LRCLRLRARMRRTRSDERYLITTEWEAAQSPTYVPQWRPAGGLGAPAVNCPQLLNLINSFRDDRIELESRWLA
jgi:hypothetical protein